jgi:hypothetical protein
MNGRIANNDNNRAIARDAMGLADLPCDEMSEHLVSYIFDDFGGRPQLRDLVERHLMRCQDCSVRLNSLRIVLDANLESTNDWNPENQ